MCYSHSASINFHSKLIYFCPSRRRVTLLYRILQFNQRVITFIDKNYHLVRKLKYKLRNFEFQRYNLF